MTPRDWLTRPVGLAISALVLMEWSMLLPVRMRVILAIHAAVAGAVTALYWRRGLPSLRTILPWLTLSFALPAMLVALVDDDPVRAVTREGLPALAGWVMVLLVLAPETTASPAGADSRDAGARRGVIVSGLGAVFVILAIAHQLAVGRFAIVSDEAIYLAQSRWMNLGNVTWELEPALAPFFMNRKVGYVNGHLFGMYPPGWPALLAVFRSVGLEWWSSVILGTISVALMGSVGSRLAGVRVGRLAAILLATSHFFVLSHAGYMSHAATVAALLGATALFLSAERHQGWRQAARWAGAGALLAVVVTVRPLTGILMGASIGTWFLVRAWDRTSRFAWQMLAAAAVGGLVPAALFLLHNVTVFGTPIALGYQVMHPGLYSLGFGPRGFRTLDANVQWTPATFDFTLRQGVTDLITRLSSLNTTFVPVGLLLPITAMAYRAGFRISWKVVGMFALVPAIHLFYWYGGLRLYSELLPFLLLGTALMLESIRRSSARLYQSLFVLLLASQATRALPWPAEIDGYRHWESGRDHNHANRAPGRWATLELADSLGRADGRVLLFTKEETRFDNLNDRLYAFNGDRFDGPVLVARDRGPALNATLIARFPDRVPYLLEDRGPLRVAGLTRLPRP